jgi:hypothetical protein
MGFFDLMEGYRKSDALVSSAASRIPTKALTEAVGNGKLTVIRLLFLD